MADFAKALNRVLSHEGGYSNVSGDTGGATYKGVSRKNWPGWPGWAIIDKIKDKRHNQIFDDPGLDCLVSSFYRAHFWAKIKGDDITHQKVAEFLFDFAVNSGVATAAMSLQRCLLVSADGIIGKQTLAAVNHFNEPSLMGCLVKSRTEFVRRIVERNPTQKKFLAGWLRRINSFA